MSLFTVTTSCLCEMESNRVLGPLPVGLLLCLAVEKSRRFSLNPTKLIQFILYSVKTNCTSHLLFSFRHLLQNTPWMSSENQKKNNKKTKARRVFDVVAGTIYLSFAYLCVKNSSASVMVQMPLTVVLHVCWQKKMALAHKLPWTVLAHRAAVAEPNRRVHVHDWKRK